MTSESVTTTVVLCGLISVLLSTEIVKELRTGAAVWERHAFE